MLGLATTTFDEHPAATRESKMTLILRGFVAIKWSIFQLAIMEDCYI